MTYLLDTNICIFIINKKPRTVLDMLTSLDAMDVGVSAITVAELEYGVANSSQPLKNSEALAAFLSPFKILSFDDQAACEYGRIRAYLRHLGQPIGAMDMLIAAHALSLDCTLVTNNTREFKRVSGLKLEDWSD